MILKKILFWVSTVLLTAIIFFSVYNYVFNHEMIRGYFENMGYPTYLIYPMATAKILGLAAVWGNFSKWLKEWAYAGFFFNSVLAFFAHYMINDGEHIAAVLAVVFVLISYFTEKEVRR